DATADALRALAADGCHWRVAHPMNEMSGNAAALAQVWHPLKAAIPDLERRDSIFVAGVYQGRTLIAATGHYCGTLRGDWLGIPATHKTVTLRYGEVWQIGPDGRAVQANLLWDVLDVMRQAGVWPLGPSLGVESAWPGPFTADGVRLAPSDPAQGRDSIEQTLRMHKSLAEFDDPGQLSRAALIAMPQRDHWHPRMMWYGPAGIGTTRGLDGFVDGHQLPFRIAFHRPQGSFEEVTAERARHGAGHYIRIGDGPYSVTGGWPSVYAIHNGGGFCGMPPSGKPVFMRVMDFYLHHQGLIRENWVPLDMLDLFRQMGTDLLARMTQVLRRPL
ncbi:MAG TPA: ester cyclase, partial [Paracoccaceae bacterium]|nr:ester cyclase [Paracoccaceae bacterium]